MQQIYSRLIGTIVLTLALGVIPGHAVLSQARSENPSWPTQSPGWQEHLININGKQRWYRIYRPAGLSQKAPLVLLLHGGSQSMYKLFGSRPGGSNEWLTLAQQKKFILLVPNGTQAITGDPKGNRQHWNDVRSQTESRTPNAQDILFLSRLLDHVEQTDSVDPQRLYVTGASNGGLMTYYLLMKLPRRFAAAAAFIANLPEHDV